MIWNFTQSMQIKQKHLKHYLNIIHGDMSNFKLNKEYDFIIIPWRALQWLPVQEKTIDCLRCIYNHLSDNGIFAFSIFKPGIYDEKWIGIESVSYNIIDGDKQITRSTINHFADTNLKFIQYLNKIKIINTNEEIVKEDMLTIKYYEHNDIVKILKEQNFKIIEEYGYYDKRSIIEGDEMIFVCSKNN